MAKQSLKQGLKQTQKQRLTPLQLLIGQMIEKPVDQLQEYISHQLIDNPALEATPSEEPAWEEPAAPAATEEPPTNDYDTWEDAIPVQVQGPRQDPSDSVSFYDKLKEQMGECDLDDRQRYIMEYLIGSLDNDGLLRKTCDTICDEMDIYHNFECTPEEVEDVLAILHDFDPPGIGASNLQQCLMLQVRRRKEGWMKDMLTKIIGTYFDDLIKNHWDKLQRALHLDDEQKESIRAEVRKLNPKPGAALGEAVGTSKLQVTPDFVVETDEEGHVNFTLNRGRLPQLEVSEAYLETINNIKGLSQRDKEALPLLRKDVEGAKMLIEAIQQRQATLTKTMAAIIKRQKKFFLDGDEADLSPMTLKDVAGDTGLDISTISRVTNEKYADTPWGVFRLRFFFNDRYDNDGDEVSTRKIKSLLKEIIDHEDKRHPLTDMQLEEEIKKRGFNTKRRTIVKYREQMNIPRSSLRKQ
ncbi:MAG: RNA polymerase factor sigma-54 [Prevotella sp.]|nr:RNA polymerase factor sigma-54 [Prevotella sp.]MBQ4295909.1 RNA polymerase factor sigma-54 [Prevotella sp.]MBR7054217.1 RNA polymerase factor sigma-54 [Prevotella sp.]